jgi:hypothetical protein
MDLVPVLALIAFGAAAILAAIQKSYALALVATGLFLLLLPKVA